MHFIPHLAEKYPMRALLSPQSARLVVRKVARLIALNLLIFIVACSSNEDKQVSTEQQLYQNAQKLLKSSNWSGAAETLQLLEENFDRFIRLHPQHRNVDYAYYMRGVASFYNETAFTTALISDVSNRDSGSAKESFNYFSQLLLRYPKSSYVLDARQRMIYLRNILARQEIHIANYYFKRGAFVAAANRGRFVVENMQSTPAVPDGLAVMAQAYHLLGMQKLADDAERVLVANYPQHPVLKDGKFNYRYKLNAKRNWLSYLTFGLLDKRQYVNFDSRSVFNPGYDTKGYDTGSDLKDAPLPPS